MCCRRSDASFSAWLTAANRPRCDPLPENWSATSQRWKRHGACPGTMDRWKDTSLGSSCGSVKAMVERTLTFCDSKFSKQLRPLIYPPWSRASRHFTESEGEPIFNGERTLIGDLTQVS